MKHTLDKIYNKKNDYKVCKECHGINWHENDQCIHCVVIVPSSSFYRIGRKVKKIVKGEILYYQTQHDYSVMDAWGITMEV